MHPPLQSTSLGSPALSYIRLIESGFEYFATSVPFAPATGHAFFLRLQIFEAFPLGRVLGAYAAKMSRILCLLPPNQVAAVYLPSAGVLARLSEVLPEDRIAVADGSAVGICLRSENSSEYCFGYDEKQLSEYAWYKDNSEWKTHPVGEKKPNGYGLYDMHGNVWEWCADWYGTYPQEIATDPTGPNNGSDRVYRGGSFGNDAWICRLAYRNRYAPRIRIDNLGVRLGAGSHP